MMEMGIETCLKFTAGTECEALVSLLNVCLQLTQVNFFTHVLECSCTIQWTHDWIAAAFEKACEFGWVRVCHSAEQGTSAAVWTTFRDLIPISPEGQRKTTSMSGVSATSRAPCNSWKPSTSLPRFVIFCHAFINM
jgi:hypothetical protein